MESKIAICETLDQLQGRIKEGAFSWAPNLSKLKEIGSKNNGHFLLIEALHPMKTDPFNIGHGAREWTAREILATTRTAIGKTGNINHNYKLNKAYEHLVSDAEYNDQTNTSEWIVWETDPEIIRLIKDGCIKHISVDGGQPRNTKQVCEACGSSGCRCHTRIEGVVLGEDNGEAFAYVVSKPGASYWGKAIEAQQPGDWNSSIRIAETNSVIGKGGHLGQMSTSIKESLIKNVETYGKLPKLLEAVKEPEKFFKVKEDLQAFNDAINGGDAMRAILILAGDVYNAAAQQAVQQTQQQQQQAPPAQPPAQQQAPPAPAADDEEEKKKKAKAMEGIQAAVTAEMVKQLPGQVQELFNKAIEPFKSTMESLKDLDKKIQETVRAQPELKEIAGLKESFKNLSGQVTETFREVKGDAASGKLRTGVRETNEPMEVDVEKARHIANLHLHAD